MKKWYESKTMWFGIGTLLVSILTATQGQEIVKNNPSAVAYIGMAIGVLTIILRVVTKKSVS